MMNRLKIFFKNLLLITFALIAIIEFPSCAKNEGPPNIIIILVDDMGYGDPACYNPDSKIPTPTIDRLANEGIRFTDAHAPGPLCHLSRYGLITGRYPFRTDISVWPHQPTIENDRITLPEMLKTAGYHTAMVGKWHLGFHERGYDKPLRGGPVDHGFDSFFGIRASTDIPPYFYIRNDRAIVPPTDSIDASETEGWSPIQGAFWRAGGIAPGLKLKDVLPRFTEEAVSVIRSHTKGPEKNKPLFLYLAYPAPHTPWLPASEFVGKSGAGLYGDFTTMVDANIKAVLDVLEAEGMSENAIILFTSDNGPVWYSNDIDRFGHDAAGGLRGMKGDAWEAGHRMPFIVKWPGKVKAGSVSARTICFTDIFATLAEITGTEIPGGAAPDSYSFLDELKRIKNNDKLRPPIVMQTANGTMMIRSGEWKLIDQLGSGGFSKPGQIKPGPGDPAGQLYNLSADPKEEHNHYLEKKEIVERLMKEMKAIIDEQ